MRILIQPRMGIGKAKKSRGEEGTHAGRYIWLSGVENKQSRHTVDKGERKEQLKLIVDRRNKIAHEADVDPSYPGVRWPITYRDSTTATDFIEGLVRAINDEVV